MRWFVKRTWNVKKRGVFQGPISTRFVQNGGKGVKMYLKTLQNGGQVKFVVVQ